MLSAAKGQLSSLDASRGVGASIPLCRWGVCVSDPFQAQPGSVSPKFALQRDDGMTLAALWWPDHEHKAELESIS